MIVNDLKEKPLSKNVLQLMKKHGAKLKENVDNRSRVYRRCKYFIPDALKYFCDHVFPIMQNPTFDIKEIDFSGEFELTDEEMQQIPFFKEHDDAMLIGDGEVLIAARQKQLKYDDFSIYLLDQLDNQKWGIYGPMRISKFLKGCEVMNLKWEKRVEISDAGTNFIDLGGNQVATLLNGDVIIHDIVKSEKKFLRSRKNKCEKVIAMHLLPEGSLATVTKKQMKIWNTSTLSFTTIIRLKSKIDNILEFKAGKLIVPHKSKLDLYTTSGIYLGSIYHSQINYIRELADGRIVTCSSDKSAKVWSKTNLDISFIHSEPVLSCCQVLAGHLITLCSGGNIYAWNLINGEKLNQIKCDKNVSYIVSFASKDGFLTGADTGEMKYWRSWEVVSTLKGHAAPILNVVSLSCVISSLSQDGTIRIWRLESGECLQTLSTPAGPYSLLKIFQNDQIAALCSNGTLHIFDRKDKDNELNL